MHPIDHAMVVGSPREGTRLGAAMEQYQSQGFVTPIDALSNDEADYYGQQLQRFFDAERGEADAMRRHKPHLRFKWVSDLVRHPRVVDAVALLLGPDVLAWRSSFFIKPAADQSHVPWHQDLLHAPIAAEGYVSAWIALTASGPDNGCVRVVPGSHRRGLLPHSFGSSDRRTLQLGQMIAEPIRDDSALDLALRAGQMSLHHGHLIHGSRGNPSSQARVGLAIRYVSPLAALVGPRETATLVRGEDRGDRFEHEPVPRRDDDPIALEWHGRSVRRYARSLIVATMRHPTRQGALAVMRMIARPTNLQLAARMLWPPGKPRRS